MQPTLTERVGRLSAGPAGRIFLGCYLALVGIVLVASPLPQMILPWEAFVFYDGGWRVLHGCVPHVDFYSPLGPLTYLISALGMLVTGGSLRSVSWGLVLASAPLAIGCRCLLSPRLAPFPCLVASLYVLGTWLLPFSMRFGFRDLTYGGLYNRESYALLLLVVLLLLYPRLRERDRPRGDMIAAGVLLGLLLALKINFLLIAGLFAGWHLAGRRDGLVRGAWMAAGFALVALPLLVYLRFDLGAVGRDFTTMAVARGPRTLLAGVIVVLRDVPLPAFFNLAALLVEARCRFLAPAPGGETAWPRWFLGRGLEYLLFVGAEVLGVLSDAPEGAHPDIPLLDIYGLVQAQRLAPYLAASTRPGWRAAVLAAIFGVAYPLVRSFALFSLGFGFCLLTCVPRLGDSYFIPMSVRDGNPPEILRVGNEGYNTDFVPAFEEGKALLARHVDIHQARIATFDETDPYPFAFRGKPPPGMPIFWQAGRSVSVAGYPPPAEVLKDCDCILVPRAGVDPHTTPVLLQVYAGTLRDDYAIVERGRYWDLYVRKPPLRP
jgi:hypothetical protein